MGGGLALTAAGEPALHNTIDPMILMGPPYSFVEIWANLWQRDLQSPVTNQEWSDFIWHQLIMAYRDHAALGLSNDELDELSQFLEIFCHENSLSKKIEVYERVVKPHGFLDPLRVPVDENELERLSPCMKMHSLGSRVFIIQDPHDILVPSTQAEKIMAELEQRNMPGRQRMLVSSMFSHVTFRDIANPSDLIATLEIFSELYPS